MHLVYFRTARSSLAFEFNYGCPRRCRASHTLSNVQLARTTSTQEEPGFSSKREAKKGISETLCLPRPIQKCRLSHDVWANRGDPAAAVSNWVPILLHGFRRGRPPSRERTRQGPNPSENGGITSKPIQGIALPLTRFAEHRFAARGHAAEAGPGDPKPVRTHCIAIHKSNSSKSMKTFISA